MSQAWASGGYSDDMLLGGVCASSRLPVAPHRAALLPQLLPAHLGWRAYWNYLRRQLYVLDTYHSQDNKRWGQRPGQHPWQRLLQCPVQGSGAHCAAPPQTPRGAAPRGAALCASCIAAAGAPQGPMSTRRLRFVAPSPCISHDCATNQLPAPTPVVTD